MAKDIEVEIFLKGGKRFRKDIKDTGKASKDASKGFSTAQASLISLSAGFNLVAQAARAVTSLVRIFADIGGAAIQAGSDFEEAAQKFGVVFGSVAEESRILRDALARDFGLSTLAATELLSATGDLLTGFGFTDKAALQLANSVNELAVDLASFSNIEGGAERTSRILTKSLLGERESLKELGISILEADVKARVLANGQDQLTGTALRAAKANATFQLILEQSTKAQDDFARSSSSLANQQRILDARLEDVSVQLGQVLVPITQVFVGELIKISEQTLVWVEANKNILASNIIGFTKSLTSSLLFVADATLEIVKVFNNFLAGISLIKSGFAALGIVATLVIKKMVDDFAAFSTFIVRSFSDPLDKVKKLFITFALEINQILAEVVDFGGAVLPDSVVEGVRNNVKVLKAELRSLNEEGAVSGDNPISKSLKTVSDALSTNLDLLQQFRTENEEAAISTFKNAEAIDNLKDKINSTNESIIQGLNDLQKEAEGGDLFKAKLSELAAIGDAEQVAAEERKRIATEELKAKLDAVSAFNQFIRASEEGQIEQAETAAALRLEGLKAELDDKNVSIIEAAQLEQDIETAKLEEIKAIRDGFREQELEADQTFQEALRESFGVTTDTFRDRGELAFVSFRDFSVDALQTVKKSADDLFTNMILGTGNTKEAFLSLGKSLLKSFIGTLTEMLIQQILFDKSSAAVENAIAIGRVKASASTGAAAAFSSVLRALPFPINIAVAPAIAASQAGAIGVFGAGAVRAQSGIDLVTRAEQPALLHLGETVLTRDETSTLTDFLSNVDTDTGIGGGVNVTIEVENLTLLSDDDEAIGNLTQAIQRKFEEQNFVGASA